MTDDSDDWIEDEGLEEGDDYSIDEYDLTASPNDFNIQTIVDFITKGVFEIPAFQRNYVWEHRRASKLIESLLIGLPVPQIFLYERERNKFLVIDGQQRLMSIYYFIQKRFPKLEKRGALRRIFDEKGQIPPEVLADNAYFINFNLKLPARLPGRHDKFDGLNYDTLGEHKTTFELRTIRSVIVKQNQPKDDDSSVYEIFNRLNTGGINLTPQEIRTSLYHSKFYALLYSINALPRWRTILGAPEPDLRMRDVQILLRGFAMLVAGDKYRPSMTRFLNQFSKDMRAASADNLAKARRVFEQFLDRTATFPPGAFGTRQKKLNISVFESVFAAVCRPAWREGRDIGTLELNKIERLKSDTDFVEAASRGTADTSKVELRLRKARDFLLGE